jgi:uncharacterized protein
MGSPIVHFEVIGSDGERLKSYYSELFGWELQDFGGPMNYATVDREGNTAADGAGIGGGIGGSSELEPENGHATFYVEVRDIRSAIDKAEELGGKRVMGPEEVPGQGIEIALVNDPEGHVVGMVESKP